MNRTCGSPTNLNQVSLLFIRPYLVVLILAIIVPACSNDNVNVLSNSGVTPTDSSQVKTELSRYTMPNEISAVPSQNTGTDTEESTVAQKVALSAKALTDSDSNYMMAQTKTYVEEQVLNQFNTIEDVLDAIKQTRYWDEIGNGPYRAMVAQTQETEDREQKVLQSWVVEADAQRDENNAYYLRVRAWIQKDFEANTPVIKAEFKIYTPPTMNSDGSYKDYGEWEMNMKTDETGEDEYFTAYCALNDDGVTVIQLNQKYSCITDGYCSCTKTKGIMYRSPTQGYGKILYPDDSQSDCVDCPNNLGPVHKTAVYAYDQNTLAIQENDEPITYKDRNQVVQITQNYGVFDATTGEDVMKTKSFGFPIKYSDGAVQKFAYYGAWMGRHEIWTHDGMPIPEGTLVTREDTGPDQPKETYKVGNTFSGVLVKKEFQEASLDDVEGIAAQAYIDQTYNLIYNEDDQKWYYCKQLDWDQDPPDCIGIPVDFQSRIGFEVLLLNANNSRKEVVIQGFDNNAQEQKFYVYQPADVANGSSAGFYEAEEVQVPDSAPVYNLKTPKTPIDTTGVKFITIWIGGDTYIVYKENQTAWFEKAVLSFDENTDTPRFDPEGDKPFSFPEGKVLVLNMKNATYAVEKTAQGYDVRLEIQTAVNPVNVNSLVPDGTVFYDQWNPDFSSTYEFVKDVNNPNYMMLVYKTIGDNDRDPDGNPTVMVGSVVRNIWNITATIEGQEVSFNWEYSENDESSGVTYLMETDSNAYKLLDDPLRFNMLTVKNNGGESKRIYLQYDGWLSGLPDLINELQKNNWIMTDAIKDKVINLPAGTQLTDAVTGTAYVLKPLEISLYLSATDNPGNLPFTAAQALQLEDVPVFQEHGMGDMPNVETIKYSEGYAVE